MRSRTGVLLSLAFVLSACGSKEGPETKGAVAPAAKASDMDMSKPYLTEKKIEGVIAVLKEKPEFWESCKGVTPVTVNAELEAVAKKYGFANFQDLATSTHRVGIGMMQASISKNAAEMQKAQAEIENDPDLSPEMKKTLQDRMTAVTAMGQDLNEADQKLVDKYFDQLEAVSRE